MRKMPVISTDPELNDRVERVCRRFDNYFLPVFIDDRDAALEYLKYELPEINLINGSDARIDTNGILEDVKRDPWLHYGGIIAVHTSADEQRVHQHLPNSNIISVIPRGEFVASFYRVVRILIQNRQILFQRDLQSYLLRTISGRFVMDNDPSNIRTYANLVTSYLYNSNYVNRDKKDRFHVAIFELLMNAVEHGNCRISYEEKSKWLQEHGDILALIRRKCTDPAIRKRNVVFSYRITPERSYFTIRDDGEGFDWRKRVETSSSRPVNFGPHGHGLKMVAHYVTNLQYNERGNEVSFEVAHQRDESNVVPGIFDRSEETVFQDGDVVFFEGEESNYLYYIASGRLSIYSGDQYLTTLTPDDIFLGEMSFLLNNRRSATVISNGRSVLAKISKNAFINAIKKQPHYGIFLARLLAQRLMRLNVRIAQGDSPAADAQSVARTSAE